MEYKISYSKRKSIGIYVHKDTSVEVRCPIGTSKKVIEGFINKKAKWINKAQSEMKNILNREVTEDERLEFIEKAKYIIPEKVRYFSNIMGISPSSIKIGNAKSYWGCCSKDNRIIFSWRLMQASDEAINYVVVHELAHIKEHNHSIKFWDEVKKVIPNYQSIKEELKKLI